MSPVRPEVTVVGQRLDSESHRLRDFLTRIAQPYRWLEDGTPEAQQVLAGNGTTAELPVLVDEEGLLERATVERVAERWTMHDAPARTDYDLAIVGAGPAGLAAAVYAASDGLTTLVSDRDVPGGQASHTSLIENFFGFPDGIGGAELSRFAGRQAERFGAELLLMRGVVGGGPSTGGRFVIDIEGGHRIEATTVIAAPGMVWRRLEVDGIDELLGRGIYYGAGRSEAAQCGGDPVVVVGAGNSAGQAVMHLGNSGARVTKLVRGDRLGKTMSGYLVDRIAAHPLIDVRLHTEIQAVDAEDGQLAGVTIRGPGRTGEHIPARALFLCLGGVPRTGWAADAGIRLDAKGYVLTGPDLLDEGRRPAEWPLARDPLALETSLPGMFAAGDVRHGSAKRVAGAVGDGAMAVALAHRRLEELTAAGG
ncbi:MAG TPA: NAD(P)/FAD-dependent oxidoreductase [Solirubrobacteraceae bacterium]|nr:NAD(P)/FAD-dependent oxidoreductase [Solirubrobacteraceae bacterium]